jgi:hypothetical protein
MGSAGGHPNCHINHSRSGILMIAKPARMLMIAKLGSFTCPPKAGFEGRWDSQRVPSMAAIGGRGRRPSETASFAPANSQFRRVIALRSGDILAPSHAVRFCAAFVHERPGVLRPAGRESGSAGLRAPSPPTWGLSSADPDLLPLCRGCLALSGSLSWPSLPLSCGRLWVSLVVASGCVPWPSLAVFRGRLCLPFVIASGWVWRLCCARLSWPSVARFCGYDSCHRPCPSDEDVLCPRAAFSFSLLQLKTPVSSSYAPPLVQLKPSPDV